jgi:hypothetical protein
LAARLPPPHVRRGCAARRVGEHAARHAMLCAGCGCVGWGVGAKLVVLAGQGAGCRRRAQWGNNIRIAFTVVAIRSIGNRRLGPSAS